MTSGLDLIPRDETTLDWVGLTTSCHSRQEIVLEQALQRECESAAGVYTSGSSARRVRTFHPACTRPSRRLEATIVNSRDNLRIDVTDRRTVESGIVMRDPYVLISIRDPDKQAVRIRRSAMCLAVLELVFHDAEPSPGFTPSMPVTYMSEDDADAIWQFVCQHERDYRAILVHCEQGMSRSPAVAAALAERLGIDGARFWREYQPNRFVYDLVRDARIEGHDHAT